ncbi:MAG TPA: hypothetical protein P5107_12685 [Thermotogota bacterium]|nr:hypothetical protein [Thermotogota bacterium]
MNDVSKNIRAIQYIVATMNYEGRILSKKTISNCEAVLEGRKDYRKIINEIKAKYNHSS